MSVGSELVAAGHDALPAVIAALLALSFLSAVLPVSRWNPRSLSLVLAALASTALLALGVTALAGGAPITAALGSVLGFAVVHVAYDQLSGLFLVALGIVGAAASVFGIGYEPHGSHGTGGDRTRAAYPVFLASLALVFGADDAFAFLLAWELMALSSAALVVGARPSRRGRPRRLPLPRADPPRDGGARRRLRAPRRRGRLDRLRGVRRGGGRDCRRRSAEHRLRAPAGRVRDQGRRDPAPRLAAARAPRRAVPRVGADVRRDDQGRASTASSGSALEILGPGPGVVGPARPGDRRRVGGARRPVRADGARPQAPARVPQHREHRDHPDRRRRRDARHRRRRAGRSPGVALTAALFHTLNHALFKSRPVPRRGLGPVRGRDARPQPSSAASPGRCRSPRSRSGSARPRSAACRRSTASRASG